MSAASWGSLIKARSPHSYVMSTVTGFLYVGGLVGWNAGRIIASYATSTVTGSGNVGRHVGNNQDTITGSYTTGLVTGSSNVGGLRGVELTAARSPTFISTLEQSGSPRRHVAPTVPALPPCELQAPTGYTGIYSNWNVDVDNGFLRGDTNMDDPWDFSNTGQYPLLKVDFDGDGVCLRGRSLACKMLLSDAQAVALASNALMIDYTPPDTNNNSVTANIMLATNVGHGVSITWGSSDPNVIAVGGEVTRPFDEANATVTLTATLSRGAATAILRTFILTVLSTRLIEVTTLEQLNAIRYDLDGDGVADNPSNTVAYTNAFPGLDPNHTYRGYKLMNNLDFAGSAWSSNQGWDPIGTYTSVDINASFRAIFEGNGNVISGLYINRSGTSDVGLFGGVRTMNAEVRNLGLSNVSVRGRDHVGGLVGWSEAGTITVSYVTGTVSGINDIGGLVGHSDNSRIIASYATASVSGGSDSGGLVGRNNGGTIIASYATGTLSGYFFNDAGGLVGRNNGGTITASYATGTLSGGNQRIGGLVGQDNGGTITASYFDSNSVGIQAAMSSHGSGLTPPHSCKGLRTTRVSIALGTSMSTTAFLRGVDNGTNLGDTNIDNPWYFGTTNHYPLLKVDFNRDGDGHMGGVWHAKSFLRCPLRSPSKQCPGDRLRRGRQ